MILINTLLKLRRLTMASSIFNATALDKLINDSLLESDDLKNELNSINDHRKFICAKYPR